MQPIATPNTANKSQETFKKIDDLKPSVSKCYFAILLKSKIFCQRNAHGHGLFNTFIFPAKKLRKIRVPILRMGLIFFKQDLFKYGEFSRQKTYKDTAPKIRMRQFFFFSLSCIFQVKFR